jgi:hypothetical protein
MKKPHNKDTQDALRERKPTAVTVHSFGSGLLDGVPRSAFVRSSGSKIIIAGPTSRSFLRGVTCQSTGTD